MEKMQDTARGGSIWITREGAAVLDTVRAMAELHIGAVPVLAIDSNRLVGMFSEGDLLRRIVAKGADPSSLHIEDVMTRTPVTAREDEPLTACMDRMQEAHCRHLPIVRQGQLVGMLSLRDALHEKATREAGLFDEAEVFHWSLSDDTGQRYLVWQCTRCSAVERASDPPGHCHCGARRNEFQLLRD